MKRRADSRRGAARNHSIEPGQPRNRHYQKTAWGKNLRQIAHKLKRVAYVLEHLNHRDDVILSAAGTQLSDGFGNDVEPVVIASKVDRPFIDFLKIDGECGKCFTDKSSKAAVAAAHIQPDAVALAVFDEIQDRL